MKILRLDYWAGPRIMSSHRMKKKKMTRIMEENMREESSNKTKTRKSFDFRPVMIIIKTRFIL